MAKLLTEMQYQFTGLHNGFKDIAAQDGIKAKFSKLKSKVSGGGRTFVNNARESISLSKEIKDARNNAIQDFRCDNGFLKGGENNEFNIDSLLNKRSHESEKLIAQICKQHGISKRIPLSEQKRAIKELYDKGQLNAGTFSKIINTPTLAKKMMIDPHFAGNIANLTKQNCGKSETTVAGIKETIIRNAKIDDDNAKRSAVFNSAGMIACTSIIGGGVGLAFDVASGGASLGTGIGIGTGVGMAVGVAVGMNMFKNRQKDILSSYIRNMTSKP